MKINMPLDKFVELLPGMIDIVKELSDQCGLRISGGLTDRADKIMDAMKEYEKCK